MADDGGGPENLRTAAREPAIYHIASQPPAVQTTGGGRLATGAPGRLALAARLQDGLAQLAHASGASKSSSL
jgi:hypothetical protein